MPEKQINLDRLAWLAQHAVNNANVAARAGLPLDEARAAVLLAVKLLNTASDELMKHAVALQAKAKAEPPAHIIPPGFYTCADGHSPLDLKPGELN